MESLKVGQLIQISPDDGTEQELTPIIADTRLTQNKTVDLSMYNGDQSIVPDSGYTSALIEVTGIDEDGIVTAATVRGTIVPYGLFYSSPAALSLPDGLIRICTNAFFNFGGTLSIPDTVEVVDEGAFRYMAFALTKLPSSLKTIGALAFDSINYSGFPNNTLFIPAGVETIGAYAFEDLGRMSSITTVTFLGTPQSIDSYGVFTGHQYLRTINVPWAEGAVSGAPWGATDATINYGVTT